MAKCERNCFNCLLDDCHVNSISKKERMELKERDFNYFESGIVIKQKPRKSRLRHSK